MSGPAVAGGTTMGRPTTEPVAMSTTRKLWAALAALLLVSFSVLIWVGTEIHRVMPPLPGQVVTTSGEVVFTREDIQTGRQVWQSIGGQQLGSIWGHGGYVAPDWTADWLHREAVDVLDRWARIEFSAPDYASANAEQQAALQARLQKVLRTNTFDEAAGTITVGADRVLAMANVSAHYQSLFSNDPATKTLREAYAMREDTVPDAEHRRQLTAF